MITSSRAYLLIVLLYASCYKKDSVTEAIPLKEPSFKTTLKNHTPGADYSISGLLEVNTTLIIESGVEIVADPGSEIVIGEKGALICMGSLSSPIVIRSREEGQSWHGIRILPSLESSMQNVHISGAAQRGSNHGAVEVMPNAKLSMKACKVESSGDASAVLICESSVCSIDGDCKFSDNAFPMQMDFHAVLNLQFTTGMTNNRSNMIRVANHDGSALTTKSKVQFFHYGLPYYISSGITVNKQQLIIGNSVSMVFEAGAGISIPANISGSSLIVNGSADRRVSFSSLHQGEDKRWAGIHLQSGDSRIWNAVFQPCLLDSAGQGILTVRNIAGIDCKYSTFYADTKKCNIAICGGGVTYNKDINTRNTFANKSTTCFK